MTGPITLGLDFPTRPFEHRLLLLMRLLQHVVAHLLRHGAPFSDELLRITTRRLDLLPMLLEQALRLLTITLGAGECFLERLLALLDGTQNRRERPLPQHEEEDQEDDQRPQHQVDAERHERRLLFAFLREDWGRPGDQQRE